MVFVSLKKRYFTITCIFPRAPNSTATYQLR